jgi:hypothetical protein
VFRLVAQLISQRTGIDRRPDEGMVHVMVDLLPEKKDPFLDAS